MAINFRILQPNEGVNVWVCVGCAHVELAKLTLLYLNKQTFLARVGNTTVPIGMDSPNLWSGVLEVKPLYHF